MLKANRLTAGQILRFKLGVLQQRAVCSPSCGVGTNSLFPEYLVSSCVKNRAKKEQSQKATGSSKEASNQSTRWLRVTQFLTNASGCHRLTWEFSWAELWRGFWGMGAWCTGATPVPSCLLQRTSRLLQHPGCETTTPPQQTQLQGMNESTQREGQIGKGCNPAGSTKRSSNEIIMTDSITLTGFSGHLFKIGGICAEKKRMFRDRQSKTSSVQTSPMEKRKTEHVAHITSLV